MFVILVQASNSCKSKITKICCKVDMNNITYMFQGQTNQPLAVTELKQQNFYV